MLLLLVDAAQSHLPDLGRLDRRDLVGQVHQLCRSFSGQAGHRHSVNVPGRGRLGGVEVGVRVHPEHPQLLADGSAPGRDRANRADRQAMVAADQDRQPARVQRGAYRVTDREVPGCDLLEVAVATFGGQLRIGWSAEVSGVVHLVAEGFERGAELGHPYRPGTEPAAGTAGADIGRGTDDLDLLGHQFRIACDLSLAASDPRVTWRACGSLWYWARVGPAATPRSA